MNFQSTVVLDKSELAEHVHEEIDPRTRRAHFRRQNILINRRNDGFHLAFLAEIGEEQEEPGQTPLARIEQLVDQVRLWMLRDNRNAMNISEIAGRSWSTRIIAALSIRTIVDFAVAEADAVRKA